MALSAPTAVAAPIVILFGLILGSFLNVIIYRAPRAGLSVMRPARSFCPACGATIRWYDNLPVWSWLWLRGRCRNCHQSISIRYPLVEAAGAVLAFYLHHRYGLSWVFLFHYCMTLCLLAIALIDLELMVIPMMLMYPAMALSLTAAALDPDVSFLGALAGLILGWGVLRLVSVTYRLFRGYEGLGAGDPPLFGLVGAYLGWQAVPAVLLLSSALALASMTIRKTPEGDWTRHAMPFGPFVVLAAFVYFVFTIFNINLIFL